MNSQEEKGENYLAGIRFWKLQEDLRNIYKATHIHISAGKW